MIINAITLPQNKAIGHKEYQMVLLDINIFRSKVFQNVLKM
jgi:hypothetical protein